MRRFAFLSAALLVATVALAVPRAPHRFGASDPTSLNNANTGLAVGAIGDGGFAPQGISSSNALLIQITNPSSQFPTNGIALLNDAGTSDTATGLKSYRAINLDGGAGNVGLVGLPQVNPNTVAVCSLSQPVAVGNAAATNYACNATIHNPTGGDAGYLAVVCNLANLGFDGGQADCTVVN